MKAWSLVVPLMVVGWLCAVTTVTAAPMNSGVGQLPVVKDTVAGFPQLTAKITLPYDFDTLFPVMRKTIATGGFNDPLNSYAWAMGVFNDELYVGTGRYVTTFHPMWEAIWQGLLPGTKPEVLPEAPKKAFMGEWLSGYSIVNANAFKDWKDGSQAEIWKYNLRSRQWKRVYWAEFVPSPFLNATGDPSLDTSVAQIMGFRSMDVLKDRTKQSALFAFTGGINMARPDKSVLILRSTDGSNWNKVETPSGMGSETRASTIHNKRLYVGAGVGPSVWYTDTSNPTKDSWKKVLDFGEAPTKDKTNSGIISLASFNGKLYVGTENINGFQVWCGSGEVGANDWKKVVDNGATDRYNAWAATMKVFDDYLYVGSIGLPFLGESNDFKGCDIIRINTRNKWQLVVGGGYPTLPVKGYENVRSISGQPSGFGNPMNFYLWSMEVYNDKLYAGTFDASVFFRYLPLYTGELPSNLEPLRDILPSMATGADLWCTSDGETWLPYTLNGFGHQDNYGMRTMRVFGDYLAVGVNNPFDGCEVHLLRSFF